MIELLVAAGLTGGVAYRVIAQAPATPDSNFVLICLALIGNVTLIVIALINRQKVSRTETKLDNVHREVQTPLETRDRQPRTLGETVSDVDERLERVEGLLGIHVADGHGPVWTIDDYGVVRRGRPRFHDPESYEFPPVDERDEFRRRGREER